MATINLTLPISGTVVTAGLHSTNYSAIQAAVNSLDNANVAVGAAIDPTKLASGYQAYVFTLAGSTSGGLLGNASSVVGRYARFGKLVHYYGQFTLGTTSSFGVGNMAVSLPVASTAAVAGQMCGTALITNHTGTPQYYPDIRIGIGVLPANSFWLAVATTYGGARSFVSGSSVVPWSWGTGDTVEWSFVYEAA